MRFDTPDPAYTGSPRSRANFRIAVRLVLVFVGLLWLVQLLNWGLGPDPGPFALKPRNAAGLAGIAFAPLLHADFGHLLANTLPLVLLGIAALHLYPRSALRALPFLYLGPGVAVWLLGRNGLHVGASGIVYGLIAFVFVAGLVKRDRRAISASMIVAFLYGTAIWGVLPIQPRVSWETHLAGALIGIVAALVGRRADRVPIVRYDWEAESVVDLAVDRERPPDRTPVDDAGADAGPDPDGAGPERPRASLAPAWIWDGQRYRPADVDDPRGQTLH